MKARLANDCLVEARREGGSPSGVQGCGGLHLVYDGFVLSHSFCPARREWRQWRRRRTKNFIVCVCHLLYAAIHRVGASWRAERT